MQGDKKIELKARNNSHWVMAIVIICVSLLIFRSIVTGMYTTLLIFIPAFIFTIIGICRIREIVFTEKEIFYQSFWTKKKRWSIFYDRIDSIKVNFLSDTKTNNKRISIADINGSIMQANILNVKMEVLGKICKKHGLKLFYELNNEYLEYRLPKYN